MLIEKGKRMLQDLGSKVSIIGGQTLSRIKAGNNPNIRLGTILAKTVGNGYLKDEDIDYVYYEVKNNDLCLKKKLTKKGDIIFKLSYPYNVSLIDDKQHEGLLVSSFCSIVRGVEVENIEYLIAYLNSSICQKMLLNEETDNSPQTLSSQQISNLIIPFVDLKLQKEIGESYVNYLKKEELFKKIVKLETERIDALIKRGVKNDAR